MYLKKKLLSIDLYTAIQSGDLIAVKSYLKQHPGSLNLLNQKGSTPLWDAVNYNQPAILRFLLQQGADPDQPNSQGVTVKRYLVDACVASDPMRKVFLKALEPAWYEMLCCCLPPSVRFSKLPASASTNTKQALTGMVSSQSSSLII